MYLDSWCPADGSLWKGGEAFWRGSLSGGSGSQRQGIEISWLSSFPVHSLLPDFRCYMNQPPTPSVMCALGDGL